MEFKIKTKESPHIKGYHKEELEIAREFAKKAYKEFKGGCLMSVSELEHLPQHALKIHNGYVIPREKLSVDIKRQDTAKMYRHDGYLIMCNTQSFFAVNDFYEMVVRPWYTPPKRNLDINTMDDLRLARWKMGEK